MSRQPFSLVELLVIIVMTATLSAVFLPARAKTQTGAHELVCLVNCQRLMTAWQMYAKDNHEVLPWAYGTLANTAPYVWSGPGGYPWDLDSASPATAGNWDCTNTIERSPLWPYCGKSVDTWHCPADTSTGITPAGARVPRPRSYSMNNWVGGDGDDPPTYHNWSTEAAWVVYRKLSDMVTPGPAQTWVVMDEREDSINDGCFVLQMTGYTGTPNASEEIVDFPATRHVQGAGVGFADGHAELHRWLDSRVIRPAAITTTMTPNSPDVFWLQDHSTRVR